MSVLVVATNPAEVLGTITQSVVRAAGAIGTDIDLLVFPQGNAEVQAKAKTISGISRVRVASDAITAPEHMAEVVKTLQGDYSHIFFSATVFSKTVMPRLAALLNVPALSEISQVVCANTFKRYIYAGSLLATVRIDASPVIATVRQSAFEPVETSLNEAPIEVLDAAGSSRTFTLTSSHSARKSDSVDLESAKIVVSAGRGVIDEEGFKAAKALAEKLHGAVGSTRALVDAFIAPADTQVGQTGKIVAPDLYFAFGISGAIQHLAGMKDSKTIVAINNDPEAPIIEVCDYWLEADAVDTINEVIAKL